MGLLELHLDSLCRLHDTEHRVTWTDITVYILLCKWVGKCYWVYHDARFSSVVNTIYQRIKLSHSLPLSNWCRLRPFICPEIALQWISQDVANVMSVVLPLSYKSLRSPLWDLQYSLHTKVDRNRVFKIISLTHDLYCNSAFELPW